MSTPSERDLGFDPTLPQPASESGLQKAAVRRAAFAKLFGAADQPPPRVHRFSILERVGAGGMGQVFAAYDPELDRRVAIKIMHPGLGGPGSQGRARLLREAQAMARLDHPNVVSIYDVGTLDDQVFIAMEFVAGGTLRSYLAQEKPEPNAALALLVQAGRGLAAAHAAGIVHRDFKPDNVMISVTHQGTARARVSDFGLARAAGPDERSSQPTEPRSDPPRSLSPRITGTGLAMGTPAYMAPEQFTGDDVGPAADQFAFCVVLHEALSGRRPFTGHTLDELRKNVLRGRAQIAPLERVPWHVRAAIRKGLSTRPQDRWPDLPALLHELERDPGALRRRIAAGVGLSCISAAAVWALRADPVEPCAIERERLGEAWSESRRSAGQQAFAATGVEYSAVVWAHIADAIDTWTDDWLARRREACIATRVRGEQSEARLDVRMSCLDRELSQLDAITTVLAEADASTLDELGAVPRALPDLDRCDSGLDIAHAPAPEPIRAQVEAVQQGLARADALKVAGRYTEGLELARALASEAEALEHSPLLAAAWLARGRMEQRSGDAQAAELTLEDAFVTADAVAYDDLRLAVAIELTWTVGHELRRFDDGRRWGRRAAAAIRRLDRAGTRAESELESNLGAIEHAARNLEAAREHEERALRITQRIDGADSVSIALDRYNLGLLAKDLGDLDGAEDYLVQALRAFEAAYGDDHPDTAQAINSLALVAYRRGDYHRASKLHAQALDVFERVMGPEHHYVATALTGLANAAERVGRYDDAERYQRRTLAILRDDDPRVGVVRANLGNVLVARERYEEALHEYGEAEAIFRAHYGDEFGALAHVYAGQGRVFGRLERRADSRSALERARTIVQSDEAADPLLAGQIGAALAPLLWEDGERATALEIARIARDAFARAQNESANEVDELDAWIAAHAYE